MALAFVNVTTGTNDGSASTIAATAASHTTGNLLAIGVNWAHTTRTLNSVADTAGNTYVRCTGSKEDAGSDNVEWFVAYNITGNASNTVTATFSGAVTFRRIVVLQYSGAATSSAFDTASPALNAVTAATSISATGGTLAQANNVLTSIMGSSGAAQLWVPTDGGTHRVNSLGVDTDAWDEIVSSTGPHTHSIGDGSTSQDAWMSGVAFKEAAAAAAASLIWKPPTLQHLPV